MRSSWVIFEVVIANMHALYLFFISEIASKTFTMLKLYNNLSTYTYTCVCVYICVWIYHYCGCLRNTNAIQYFNRLSSSRESHGGIIVYSPHTYLVLFTLSGDNLHLCCHQIFFVINFSSPWSLKYLHLIFFHLLFTKLYFMSFIFFCQFLTVTLFDRQDWATVFIKVDKSTLAPFRLTGLVRNAR